MILFVVDQVAGAEYIFPLLNRWKNNGNNKWVVIASDVSASFLAKSSIECMILNEPTIAAVKAIIDRANPTAALISSSGVSSLEDLFLSELKNRNVPSFKFIDCWVNYSKRFERTDSLGVPYKLYPDKILTIDSMAKKEMMSDGINAELIEIVGQPYFEHCFSTINETAQSGDDRVLMVTQPVSRHYGERLGYNEKSFIKVGLDAWKNLKKDWSKLSILVHPAEDLDWYIKFASEYSPEIPVLRGDACDLRSYALVVGMFSSMMIQSVLLGVDTVSLQPDVRGDDLSFLSRHGYIRKFTSGDEYLNYLNGRSASKNRDTDMASALKRSLHGSCDRLEKFIIEQQNGERNE